MANNLRIFKTEKESNTTDRQITITRFYVCDGVSHYVQTLLEIADTSGKIILSYWERRIQLGGCDWTSCYNTFGFLPTKAEMKFLSISLIDPNYNKKDGPNEG